MALSSVNLTITNNPFKGCVDIVSESNTVSLGSIAYLMIFRKLHVVGSTYSKIYEKAISSVSDLTFNDIDLTAKCNTSYDYYIELANGHNTGYTVLENETISNVQSYFEGLFIGNNTKQFVAHLDCSTSITRNTQSNYVVTLAGRTPYKVSNSNLNYTSGQSSGLFLQVDENNELYFGKNDDYIQSVVDFLSDDTDKILKTSDGGIWYVSIDPGVSVAHDNYYKGYNEISFSWTEIGDVPVLKVVA